ncbi:MAG: acyltransferase [Acidobacteriota bacterium]|nr:acyltransferase [Acidobacteriota bacterium]
MNGQRATPETREPITSGTRSNIVDIVKGIAIILVVYGHTAQGMAHRDWWSGPGAVFSDVFIYSFHMPVFFFVAGLFAMGSLAKRGSRHFVVDKVETILYPYLFIAVLGTLIEPFIWRFKAGHAPFHWNVFLLSLTDGDANWFLFVLFLCLMLALFTARVPDWLRFAAATLVALLPPLGASSIYKVPHEFCFMAAGMWVGKRIYRLERMRTDAAALLFFLLAAFQVWLVHLCGPSALWRWTYIILGLTGTAGVLLLAKLLDKHQVGKSLAWVGRASLGIFLLSAFAQGAAREVLFRGFHTREFWLQLLVPTLFAIVLPAIVWHQQDRWRVGWIFRWPF